MTAMHVATKFPITLDDRIGLGAGEVSFPATWNEYLDLLKDCEYQTEYEDQKIIAMSIASDPHERIVANILGILYQIIGSSPDLVAYGSNRHVFIPAFEADYSPDASVLKGEPAVKTLRKGLTAYTNPHIIFEVLSKSTSRRDWTTKLPRYKKIPSLRQIVYIEQDYPFVSVFNRIEDSHRWENVDCHELEDAFLIAGESVQLNSLYLKVEFPPKEEKSKKGK